MTDMTVIPALPLCQRPQMAVTTDTPKKLIVLP